MPGDEALVGEPEIIDVAGQEQGIAKLRGGVEEGEEGFLVHRRFRAEMGIGNDDETLAIHGAKGGA